MQYSFFFFLAKCDIFWDFRFTFAFAVGDTTLVDLRAAAGSVDTGFVRVVFASSAACFLADATLILPEKNKHNSYTFYVEKREKKWNKNPP